MTMDRICVRSGLLDVLQLLLDALAALADQVFQAIYLIRKITPRTRIDRRQRRLDALLQFVESFRKRYGIEDVLVNLAHPCVVALLAFRRVDDRTGDESVEAWQ